MTDCPPLVLPQLPTPSLWLPLAVIVVLSVGALLAIVFGLSTMVTLHQEGRRHAALLRVQDEMFAEAYPDLYAAQRARSAELEARIALVLAQEPRWWHRFTRRGS